MKNMDYQFEYFEQCNVRSVRCGQGIPQCCIERAGSKYLFSLSLVKNIANSEVRIFAVSKEGVASEVIYHKEYKLSKKS